MLRHIVKASLIYLAEKVGQDLLREGGCHRAELRGRVERVFMIFYV